MILIALYLVAIVIANLSVAVLGPSVSIVNAFVFIGLDLTTRDILHERWHNNGLWWRMLLLISVGSALSYALNASAGPIALASFLAFGAAGIVDALAYQILGSRTRFIRINGSNVFSAALDSLVFPAVAFGFPVLWGIVAGQFVAKVAGGLMWSLVLQYAINRQFRSHDESKSAVS